MARELSAKHQRIVGKTAEKLAGTASRQADKRAKKAESLAATAEQVAAQAAKAARHAETLDRLATHLDAIDVWTHAKPEGRKPKLSRDQLAAAAIRLCDTEGIEALSMRRLATELGVGTMSLYHYVRTKDELFTLVFDEIAAELLVPDEESFPEQWREAVALLARRSLAALRRHPWALDISDDPPIGPNGTRHFDQSLRATASYPGTLEDRLDLIMSVDEFVFGHFIFERNNFAEPAPAATAERMVAYVEQLLRSGDYPEIERLRAELGLAEAWRRIDHHGRRDGRFERNLARLLDGFEQAAAGTRSEA